MKTNFKHIYYPESRFGDFTNIDGTIAFYARAKALMEPSSVVLDVGCGSGSYAGGNVTVRKDLRIFKGKCAKVIGIDVDEDAKHNPFIDEFRIIGPDDRWPLEDRSIDLCICDSVLEHIENPDHFFAEFGRVMKRGGYLCIRTPNLLSYFGLISKFLPKGLRNKAISVAQNGLRPKEDIYPVFYRCNTKRKIGRMLERHGFDACVYGYEAEPNYLSFSRIFYYLGVLHQRFAPNPIKITIFAFAKKR